MNVKLLEKAVRLKVVPRRDGSYHVEGGLKPVYTVRFVDGAAYCDCTAGKFAHDCKHKIAALYFIRKQKAEHA